MDDKKRKQLTIITVVFIALVLVATIGFAIFGRNDLPPTNDTTPATSTATPGAGQTTPDTSEVTLQGITLKGFNTLRQKSITDGRIDVIRFYLAQYANSTSGKITSFKLDETSIKQDLGNELKKTTFNATASNGDIFKVELSYVYSADAFVFIYDKNGALVQSTPTESD